MDETVRRYLAEIGGRGGRVSKRKLSSDEARRMVQAREARRQARATEAQIVDWSGVAPSEITIEPLTPRTFAERLDRLTAQVTALRALRNALRVVQTAE